MAASEKGLDDLKGTEATGLEVGAGEEECGRPVTPEPQMRWRDGGDEPEVDAVVHDSEATARHRQHRDDDGAAERDTLADESPSAASDGNNGRDHAADKSAEVAEIVRAIDRDDDPEVAEIEKAMSATVSSQRSGAADSDPEVCPLGSSLAPATAAPVDAFGDRIVRWAKGASKTTRTPLEMCLVSVLAFVNLAVQGLADVKFVGSPMPISLYFLVVGSSGSGKSSLFKKLLAPVARFQEALKREYEAKKAEIAGDKDRQPELDGLIQPFLYFTETTVAAMHFFLNRCRGAIGLFNEEAVTFFGGHSMKRDSHAEMIGYLSNLNDATPVTIFRKAEGAVNVANKRFCSLLMSQWAVVSAFLGDPLNRRQGILSRFQMCYPDSIIGTRKYQPKMEIGDALEAMQEYDRFMARRLNQALPVNAGTTNDLTPPTMEMTDEAEGCFAEYHDAVEQIMGKFRNDSDKLDLVNKSPAMALRIAATLQLTEDCDSPHLEAEFVRRGVQIARYFLEEALRLCTPPTLAEDVATARTLVDFLKEKGRREFDLAWWYSRGLHSLRDKKVLQPVLALLVDYGWLKEIEQPKRAGGGRTKKIYRLTDGAMRELGMLPK